MNFKIGSLFDGSGGFPLAASLCGGTPVWASEVEPFPIAVTKSRFPNMKHLGSVTDVKGNEVEPVDVITFGSPCQDLSVAGKRAGLKHTENGDEETTRSGLFMEAVRIIKEMREATNGQYPRFAVWENVPGAYSSNKGEDFRTVCEELIKIVEPGAVMPAVPKNGWPYADSYCGEGWSLSYRTYDAQYWGVPQRRRRIYLVADFRGECAGKVSFEREGLRGYFETGRTPRQGTSSYAETGVGADDRRVPYTLKIRSGCEGGGKGALIQTDKSATLATNNDQYLFQPVTFEPGIAAREGGHIYEGVSGTLRANAGDNQMSVAYADMILDDQGGSQISVRDDGKCPTLRAETHGNIPCVFSIENHPADSRVNIDESGKVQTLTSRMGTGGHYIEEGGPAPSLRTGHPPGVCFRYIVRRLTPTECARLQGFADAWAVPDSKEDLTDEEYEFWCKVNLDYDRVFEKARPNEGGWYNVWRFVKPSKAKGEDFEPYWEDTGKPYTHKTKAQMLTWHNKLHTDSSEYKLWGNGIALPTALYVMQGIADVLNQ